MSEAAEPELTAPAPLAADHDLELFASRVRPLDDWLKGPGARTKRPAHRELTLYAAAGRWPAITALPPAQCSIRQQRDGLRRNMPNPVPAALLARLAVDRRWQGRGLGSALLRDAVLRVIGAAEMIGMRAMLVHAISDDAKAFYVRVGFAVSPIEPMTLMITIDEARRMLLPPAS